MNDPNLRRLMIHGIILFGLILFALFFAVRCPYCRHALPLRCLWTSYCPHCGEKLD